jgi:hypothetical protein
MADKQYKVREIEAESSGVASVRISPDSVTFQDSAGNEVGNCSLKWTGQGSASGILTPQNAKPIKIEIHFAKLAAGGFKTTGTLDGKHFSITTSNENRIIAREPESSIKIDPAAISLLKAVPGISHEGQPNPPTVPAKQHEKERGIPAKPVDREFDAGGCAIAIMAAVEIMELTAGLGGFWAGAALGYGCHP